MITRSIEDIENELSIVDERIHSKKLLLEDFPDDLGLKLSIKTFEGRKKELIRELTNAKNESTPDDIYNIKIELKKIQELLAKSRELKALNFGNKTFGIDIKSLESVERHLIGKLVDHYLEQNVSIYEIRLTGKDLHDFRMPIIQLGEVLREFQNVVSSIFLYRSFHDREPNQIGETVQSALTKEIDIQAELDKEIQKREKKEEKKKNMLSDDMVVNSELYTFGMLTGSVRIILSSASPSLDNTVLNDTFTIFKDIVNCGVDRESLQTQIMKIGDPTPIGAYKHFLSTLFSHDMNLEFSGRTKDLNKFNIFKLSHEDAKSIHTALDKTDKPHTTPIIKVGTFRAVDLDKRTFKFQNSNEKELIPGKFDKELISEMENKNFHEIYKVKMEASIPTDKLKKNLKTRYELKKFLS